MMRRLLLCLFFALFAATAANAANAAEVAGTRFADTAQVGAGPSAAPLQLNGLGVRSRFFIKAYAIGLYLPEKKLTAADALAVKGAKRLHIVSLMELSAEQFADALIGGLQKNHSDGEMAALQPRTEEFKNAILSQKTAAKGARIDIDFLPESGTRLVFDGRPISRDIPGEDFYRALMKIWLGEKPAQDDLKDQLLGKTR